VEAQALLAFLATVEMVAAMPAEPAKTEQTQLGTERVVAEVAGVVPVETGQKVMSALFTGAQTKC
jgi:hypothetical protein